MRHMIHMREIRKAVGHIFGANFRHMHLLYMIHVVRHVIMRTTAATIQGPAADDDDGDDDKDSARG